MAAPAGSDIATALGRPFTINELTLRNRIVMAPMTRRLSPDGIPGPDVAAYYARRAANQVGLIITEGTYINRVAAAAYPNVPFFHGDKPLAGWANVVDEVHQAGGAIMPQLWHTGLARDPRDPDAPPAEGPSGIGLNGAPHGRAMTQDDIDAVIAAFAQAAADARRIGFDGVELHGAHGYLIDSFLWAGTNHRTDGYGGDPVSRARFATEIVRAVRAAVSPEFPVVFRFSQWKSDNYDAKIAETPAELERILTPLAEAGVDVFHASTRRYWLPEFDGSDLNLAGWAKKLTGKPTITVGSVGLKGADFVHSLRNPDVSQVSDLGELEARLARNEFDLVAVGRALISDPNWAAKVRDGRTQELQPFAPESMKVYA